MSATGMMSRTAEDERPYPGAVRRAAAVPGQRLGGGSRQPGDGPRRGIRVLSGTAAGHGHTAHGMARLSRMVDLRSAATSTGARRTTSIRRYASLPVRHSQ
jgi:hypothetical protein